MYVCREVERINLLKILNIFAGIRQQLVSNFFIFLFLQPHANKYADDPNTNPITVHGRKSDIAKYIKRCDSPSIIFILLILLWASISFITKSTHVPALLRLAPQKTWAITLTLRIHTRELTITWKLMTLSIATLQAEARVLLLPSSLLTQCEVAQNQNTSAGSKIPWVAQSIKLVSRILWALARKRHARTRWPSSLLILTILVSENYKLNVHFDSCINVAHSIYIAVTNANTC